MEYVRTHPLTEERIDAVRAHYENSPPRLKDAKLDQRFYDMHERMKAKLLGYLQPETALLRYTDKETRIPARYALAIALYRTSQMQRALAVVETLIHDEPNKPFFHEMKAKMIFETGRIEEAIGEYKKANEILPDSSLLRQAYGHAPTGKQRRSSRYRHLQQFSLRSRSAGGSRTIDLAFLGHCLGP